MRLKSFFIIGLVAVTILTFLTIIINKKSDAQNSLSKVSGGNSKIPVQVKQLPAEKGVIPIELKCKEAELSAPNAFEKLNCTATNNTGKNITALVAAYTFSMEENGMTASMVGAINIDALLHPDFFEQLKKTFIHPNEETPLHILPTTLGDDSVIKEVTLQIDYAEFESGAPIGEKSNGRETIRQIRQGVAIYKEWFAKKYTENGRTEQAITELLQNRQSISKENLGDLTPNQLEGARVLRKFIRRVYSTKGIEAVNDILRNK
jgi:hypothetical protein